MNRQNSIDRKFAPLRESTEDAPMHLWEKIEAQIEAPSKDKRRFFWLSLLGLMLVGLGSVIALSTGQKSPKLPAQSTPLQNTNIDIQKTVSQTPDANTVAANLLPTQSNSNLKQQSLYKKNTLDNQKIFVDKPLHKQTHLPQAGQATNPTSNTPSPITQSAPNNLVLKTGLVQNIPCLSLPLPENSTPLPNLHFAQAKPKKGCVGSRVIKVPKSVFIDAYAAPIFSSSFYSARSPEAKSYARLRDSTEHNAVGLLAGVRVGYIHESGLNFRAGLAWQQIRNRFNQIIEQDEKMIVHTHRDDLGNIIGRDTTFEYGRRRLDITNKYTSIDLPLSIGYISMKNKVQLGLHVGAVLNLNFSQSGTYINQEHQIATFAENQKIFNKSMGTSFFGAVELQYLLSERWGIFLEPQARFYPKSLTSAHYPLKQNITTFNVLTGVKYIF